ncbi:hypothetical protein J7J90_01485 [Candidatus Micrarchaeota archaeon]|nr:hypothetical protein [Candidatus Micrarchaeota archaeon]
MTIKKVGYKMPNSMAGVMGAGNMEIGGIPIDPKMFIIGVIFFIIIINVFNIIINYFIMPQ